jgi:hypothetical protein
MSFDLVHWRDTGRRLALQGIWSQGADLDDRGQVPGRIAVPGDHEDRLAKVTGAGVIEPGRNTRV